MQVLIMSGCIELGLREMKTFGDRAAFHGFLVYYKTNTILTFLVNQEAKTSYLPVEIDFFTHYRIEFRVY